MYQFIVNMSLISTYFKNTCPIDTICLIHCDRQSITNDVIYNNPVQSLVISADFLTDDLFPLSVKADIVITDQFLRQPLYLTISDISRHGWHNLPRKVRIKGQLHLL